MAMENGHLQEATEKEQDLLKRHLLIESKEEALEAFTASRGTRLTRKTGMSTKQATEAGESTGGEINNTCSWMV